MFSNKILYNIHRAIITPNIWLDKMSCFHSMLIIPGVPQRFPNLAVSQATWLFYLGFLIRFHLAREESWVGKLENHWFTAQVIRLYYAQIVNISGFGGPIFSIIATEPGHCGIKSQLVFTWMGVTMFWYDFEFECHIIFICHEILFFSGFFLNHLKM